MKKNFKIIFLSIGAAASMLLCSCESDTELPSIELPERVPETSTINYEINYYKGGKVIATLGGKKLNKYVAGEDYGAYEELLDSVHVLFYNDTGAVVNELTSKYAIRYSDTEIMEAKDSVVVFNEKGEKLETEHLIWDQKKEEIVCDTNVVVTKQDQVIRGTGLKSDQHFRHYEIDNPKDSKFFIDGK